MCSEKPFIDETFHETNKKLKEFCESSYPNYSIQLLPVKSVGVQGDGRSYKYPAAVFGPENWEILCQITHRLPTVIFFLFLNFLKFKLLFKKDIS